MKLDSLETFDCSGQISPKFCDSRNNRSVFLQILHQSSGSWDKTPLYFQAKILYNLRSLSKYKFSETLGRIHTHFDSFLPSTYKIGIIHTVLYKCLRIRSYENLTIDKKKLSLMVRPLEITCYFNHSFTIFWQFYELTRGNLKLVSQLKKNLLLMRDMSSLNRNIRSVPLYLFDK